MKKKSVLFYLNSNETGCYGQYFCIICSFSVRFLLKDTSQDCWNRNVNSRTQRWSVIVDQHDIVTVKLWNSGLLILLQSHKYRFFLLSFYRNQNLITCRFGFSYFYPTRVVPITYLRIQLLSCCKRECIWVAFPRP